MGKGLLKPLYALTLPCAVGLALVGGAGGCSSSTPSTTTMTPATPAPVEVGPVIANAAATGPQMKLAATLSDGVVVDGVRGLNTLTVRLTATSPFHVNDEYPHRFVPDEATDLPAGAWRELKAFVVDDERHGTLHATLERGGATTIAGRFFTSVCSAEKCLIEKIPLTLTVPAS